MIATSPIPVPNGNAHVRRHDSSSSESSQPKIFSNHSTSSHEVLISKLNRSNGSGGGNYLEEMTKYTLKKGVARGLN